MHISQQDTNYWMQASDEQHIQGLLQRPAFPSPRWMSWLKRNRPHVISSYLNLYQQGGGYLAKPAKDWLKNHK